MPTVSMDEGTELTGWGGKEHEHGTHGTRAPCVSLTLSLGSLCLSLTRGQVPLHLVPFSEAWAAPAQWAEGQLNPG